jgi:predicted NBD/HSP70 family sugar kinase
MTRPSGSARLLRAINSSATLSHLLSNGRLTRAELRDLTGLSKPTSSEMLRLLTEAGLAVVAGRTAGAPGPTAEIYAPNPDAAYVVAVSVRDTTGEDRPDLAYAVGDLAGETRHRHEEWVDFAALGPAEAVAYAVDTACAGAGVDLRGVRQVQLGVAGSYDPRADIVHQTDVPAWDVPGVTATIAARLADVVAPDASIAIDNDVNLAAIAERHRGVVRDAEGFAMLWLDHGLGLAMDIGGSLLRGARGSAGEIGYLPIYRGSRTRGAPADLQEILGGPAVVQLARDHGVDAGTPAAAVRAASTSDAFMTELAQRVAYALATIVAVLDPPLVVLAGSVAQAGGTTLRDAVVTAFGPHRTDEEVEIAVTTVDDDSVLLGALDAGQEELRESLISSLARLD